MMEYNRNIDIIIPAYNVPDHILFRCLASIACQEIVSELEITIVDDASTKQNYAEVIKNFNSIMKINLLRYENNGGPGVARQYGLDHTHNGYITFIDADDTFYGAFALQILKNNLEENDNYKVCVGNFCEITHQNNEQHILIHTEDMVWVFGKLYRRSFIDEYNINFHPTSRANEDNGFNTLLRLCMDEENKEINYIKERVYCWHDTLEGITKKNNQLYTYGDSKNDSFYGYVENMIYAIQESQKRKPTNNNIAIWSIEGMIKLYNYYIQCTGYFPEFAKNNLKWCKMYYDEIYSKLEPRIAPQFLNNKFNIVIRDAYRINSFHNIIPCMTYSEFLDKLKKE